MCGVYILPLRTSQVPVRAQVSPLSPFLSVASQVAERWDASRCITACVEALCTLTPHLFPISTVLMMSSELCVRDDIKQLQEAAQRLLLELYGDVPDVIRTPAKLAELQQLPYSTMLALLGNPDLSTDSEASVLVLLWSWFQHNRNNCSSKQLKQVKELVRYSRLTDPYVCENLPHMSELSLTLVEMDKLRMDKVIEDASFVNLAASVDMDIRGGWYLPARDSDASLLLTLEVSRVELFTLAAELAKEEPDPPMPILSKKVFGFGYEWRLSLQRATENTMGIALELEAFLPMGGKAKVRAACHVKFILPRVARDGDDDGDEEDEEPAGVKGYVTSSRVPPIKEDVIEVESDGSLGSWGKYLDTHNGVMSFGVEFSIYAPVDESEDSDWQGQRVW